MGIGGGPVTYNYFKNEPGLDATSVEVKQRLELCQPLDICFQRVASNRYEFYSLLLITLHYELEEGSVRFTARINRLRRSFSVMVNREIYEYERGRYLDENGAPLLRSLRDRFECRPVILIATKVYNLM